jgi:hypothetical protein
MENIKQRYVPTDRRGWIRDTETGALLSVDRVSQKNHKEKIDRHVSNIDELNSLKDEVSQLKQLVKKLVEDN